ncbi:HEPN domain-containing protein [Rhizobium sp.]|jgi:hypothetical protein|uniref:HEPN domain-containing protein n=1 Tax=Rhizobium sp. TaxID=391 RepID=UPI000E97D7CB|nr:hypothetical protein [Rhizobium sp.]
MARITMADRLVESAEQLLESRPRSATFRRRAISSAYYAVFHALAQMCADVFLPDSKSEEEILRIYRALDHGQLRTALIHSSLKTHTQFGRISTSVVELQQERHRADYLPPDVGLFPLEDAKALVERAKLVVSEIRNMDVDHRRLLATHILFKERKS